MIYENNSIFLFEKDLMPDFRGINLNELDLRMFSPKDEGDKYQRMLKMTHMVVYVDIDKRMIMHLLGPRKGRVESY